MYFLAMTEPMFSFLNKTRNVSSKYCFPLKKSSLNTSTLIVQKKCPLRIKLLLIITYWYYTYIHGFSCSDPHSCAQITRDNWTLQEWWWCSWFHPIKYTRIRRLHYLFLLQCFSHTGSWFSGLKQKLLEQVEFLFC